MKPLSPRKCVGGLLRLPWERRPSLAPDGVRRGRPGLRWLGLPLTLLYSAPLLAAAPALAQETTAPQRATDRVQATPLADGSTVASEGRRHPHYQVFAHRASLPSVTILGKQTMTIAGVVKIDATKPNEVPVTDQQTLAHLFVVPPAVIQEVLDGARRQPGGGAEQLAQRLRTAAIDYRYLQDRWAAYHPPVGKEKPKSDALEALQAGDTNRAWEMYQALPRPQPPGGLHIAAQ